MAAVPFLKDKPGLTQLPTNQVATTILATFALTFVVAIWLVSRHTWARWPLPIEARPVLYASSDEDLEVIVTEIDPPRLEWTNNIKHNVTYGHDIT